MIPYLLKTIFCSALFLLFYKAVLEKGKAYKFNRFYLIAALVLPFIIPVLSIPEKKIQPLASFAPVLLEVESEIIKIIGTNTDETYNIFSGTDSEIIASLFIQEETVETLSNYNLLFITYLLISGFLLTRLIYSLYRFRRSILQTESQKLRDATLIFSNEKTTPYTVLHYIFVRRNQPLSEEIICHEMAHVKQKHTLDIILIELLMIFYWFNPMLLFYRKSIILNHEYLADESVLKSYTNKNKYIDILLNACNEEYGVVLSHRFDNYSTIKKRVKMMIKKNSKTMQWLRFLAIVPLAVVSLILFSGSSNTETKNTSQQPQQKFSADSSIIKTVSRIIFVPQHDTVMYNNIIKSIKRSAHFDTIKYSFNGQHDEFMQLVEKNSVEKDGCKFVSLFSFSRADLDRMKEIFIKMSEEQQTIFGSYQRVFSLAAKDSDFLDRYMEFQQILNKNMVEKARGKIIDFGSFSKTDMERMKEIYLAMSTEQQVVMPYIFERQKMPAEKIPTAAEYELWKDASKYGVWIDGKKVDNSELARYKHSDFSYYFVSGLTKTAKDYGKYLYHLSLETTSNYQASKVKREADENLYLWPQKIKE